MKALVLSGGGARGAYQVGVLKALGEICREMKLQNPFKVYSGVSAGAINACFLAQYADQFSEGTEGLEKLWAKLDFSNVFKSDALSLSKVGLKIVSQGLKGSALLDTSPLYNLIGNNMDFLAIAKLIESEKLHSLALTAIDYASSTATTFVQGHPKSEDWVRSRRKSEKTKLSTAHVMASSAIPLLFPAVEINGRYYGDGCVRNLTPLSPAIHLGADRIFVIGVRRLSATVDETRAQSIIGLPSFGRVINTLFNAVMLDGIEMDVERLHRVNEFLRRVPKDSIEKMNFSPVDFVWVHPSGDIGEMAHGLAARLPRLIRFIFKGLGPLDDSSELISYLMFENEFCKSLIDMGYQDAQSNEVAIRKWLKA